MSSLSRFLISVAMICACGGLAGSNGNNGTSNGKAIIVDTDIFSDCDDVGALAVANALHNCGYADLRGVMINTHSKYGALAASAVNRYFGNGGVPIGAIKPLTNETFHDTYKYTLGEYVSKVAYNFPRTLNDSEQTPTPTELYTSILTAAEPNTLTLISIGFLTNLAALFTSKEGLDLISTKVRELVIMGGRYPSGWEYNFGGVDPESAAQVLQSWPRNVPITYSGYELGKPILTGKNLRGYAPADSPVLAAYEWYVGRCGTVRESWDLVTVLYGVIGLGGIPGWDDDAPVFEYANEHGYNSIVAANGSNAWVDDPAVVNQHWLRLAGGVSTALVERVLDRMLAGDPRSETCFGEMREAVYDDETMYGGFETR